MPRATAYLACNENSPLGELAQYPIEIRVGPEVIAGKRAACRMVLAGITGSRHRLPHP